MALFRNSVRVGQSPPFTIPRSGQWVKHYSVNNTTIHTFTNQILIAIPVPVQEPMSVSALGVYVQAAVALSTIRLGIYAPNPANYWNAGALLIDGGTIDSSTTGDKTLVITSTPVQPPFIWLAAVALGTGVGTQRNNTGNLPTDNASHAFANIPAASQHDANVTAGLPATFSDNSRPFLGSPVLCYRRA
jgi:hypothetical protein